MKKQYNIFVCDTCGNESKPLEDKHKIHSGYPYEDGWLYLYNFTFKQSKDIQKSFIDKHFCCKECLKRYITNLFIDEDINDYLEKLK